MILHSLCDEEDQSHSCPIEPSDSRKERSFYPFSIESHGFAAIPVVYYHQVSRPKPMQLDILLQICARVDNETLSILSRTPLWSQIRLFAESGHFWYLRVEHLTSRSLPWRVDLHWKELYYLVRWKEERQIMLFRDPTTTEVLEYFCSDTRTYSKSVYLFRDCCYLQLPNLARTLIRSSDIPDSELTAELSRSCASNQSSIVSLLLEDGRADPASHTYSLLYDACVSGHADILKLLLDDGRADAELLALTLLSVCSTHQRPDMVQILIRDDRVRRVAIKNPSRNCSRMSILALSGVILALTLGVAVALLI